MTLLVRKIDDYQSWENFSYAETLDDSEIPLGLVREFIPATDDKNLLSMYEVDTEEDIINLAAAFAFSHKKIDTQGLRFAYVDRDKLNGVAQISSTRGHLRHTIMDQLHRDVAIHNIEAAVRVARHFLAGEYAFYEGKDIGRAARAAASLGYYSYAEISQSGLADVSPRARNLILFIAEKAVRVVGSKSAE